MGPIEQECSQKSEHENPQNNAPYNARSNKEEEIKEQYNAEISRQTEKHKI
jgi:hypothetical protein